MPELQSNQYHQCLFVSFTQFTDGLQWLFFGSQSRRAEHLRIYGDAYTNKQLNNSSGLGSAALLNQKTITRGHTNVQRSTSMYLAKKGESMIHVHTYVLIFLAFFGINLFPNFYFIVYLFRLQHVHNLLLVAMYLTEYEYFIFIFLVKY